MGRKKKYNTEEEQKVARRERNRRYAKCHHEKHKDDEQYKADKRERSKRWRNEHPEYNAEWRNNNPEYDADYYQQHKDEKQVYNKEYRATPFGRAITLVNAYRKKDKKYNRGECTIDAQWIVDNVFSGQVCHYCGESDWKLLGCVRKDSSLPHTPENCVPCCVECNNKKGLKSYHDYMKMIEKVV